MIQIDMELPHRCADCPMLVKIPEVGLKPTWLCRVGWKEMKEVSIFEERAEFCTMRKVKSERR